MNGFKLLTDTNIVIGLEDHQPVQASLAELVRLSGENAVGLFVDGANHDDVTRDKDAARRAVTLSKLAKFQQLRGIPLPPDAELIERFGQIKSENDRSDVRLQHRDCWVLEIDDQIAGIVIRKDEDHAAAGTRHLGPEILKVCTFKVRDEFRGEKFGELLLKQVLWFAQRNGYDVVYLTVFPKHGFLIDLLAFYGFEATAERNGERVMEKVMVKGPLPAPTLSIHDEDRRLYPRFHDGQAVRKFCIPIQPDYHRRLFPEIAKGKALPLFPGEVRMLDHRRDRTPGNTIRKVYLCRANITRLRPGDLLFFYMSKDEAYALSQSITTVGIVEQVNHATTTEDLIRLTAKRSVYTEKDLHGWRASAQRPVKVIDFLLVGHIEPPLQLDELITSRVFNRIPPQSIAELDAGRYTALRPNIKLGFDL